MGFLEIKRRLFSVKNQFPDNESLSPVTSLVIAIGDYILEKESVKEMQPEFLSLLEGLIPQGYISLPEFGKKYIFISTSSLGKYCRYNEEFKKNCSYKVNPTSSFWFVHEERTIEFLRKIPIYKKRIDRGFFKDSKNSSIS